MLRSDGDVEARSRVAAVFGEGRACLADIVLVELWNGARGRQERRELRYIEEAVAALPTSEAVWERARELAQACRRGGVTLVTAFC